VPPKSSLDTHGRVEPPVRRRNREDASGLAAARAVCGRQRRSPRLAGVTSVKLKGLGAMLGVNGWEPLAPSQGVVRRVDVGTQYIRVSQLISLIYPSTDGDR
jgi:hypothetical protein